MANLVIMNSRMYYRYFILIYLIITFYNVSIGQIDVDSLKSVAENSYSKIESKPDYFGVVYTKYMDKSGNLVFLIYSKNGIVVDGDNGFNYAISQSFYDDKSRIIKNFSFGADGNFKKGETPPITYYYYDKRDNEIRVDWFDENNRPMKGSARIEYEYDKKNNMTEKKWYNEEYKLDGETSILRNEYSKRGRVVKTSKYGGDGELFERDNVAYQIIKYITKNRVLVEEVKFLDKFSRPSEGFYEDRTKFHKAQFKYNKEGKLIGKVMFDKNGIEIKSNKT